MAGTPAAQEAPSSVDSRASSGSDRRSTRARARDWCDPSASSSAVDSRDEDAAVQRPAAFDEADVFVEHLRRAFGESAGVQVLSDSAVLAAVADEDVARVA